MQRRSTGAHCCLYRANQRRSDTLTSGERLPSDDAILNFMGKELAQQYDTAFFEEYVSGAHRSAAVVVPLVNSLVRPRSVLDVGCGTGVWLLEWINNGVTDVLGLDGNYLSATTLQIPPANFRSADLQRSFSLDRKFDLVQSLEVAEHLDESCADTLVKSLAVHADTILFSAAIPGQGGIHHVNEQWPSYWIEKFSSHGLQVFDIIRPTIWTDPRVERWYRQNIFLFSKRADFRVSSTLVDVVNPDSWKVVRNSRPSLRECVSSLPGAMSAEARKRLPLTVKWRRRLFLTR